jgi:hypothetical protein
MFVNLSHAIESSFVECWLPVAMIKNRIEMGAISAGGGQKRGNRISLLSELCSILLKN